MGKQKTLVIPRYLVTIRFIDVPSLDELEIEKMVEYQAIKEMPYSKEDMIISYANLGSFKTGFSSIMLVIANKHIISERLRMEIDSNIKIENIRLHTELLYLFLFKRDIIKQDKVSFVIHIGKDDSEIIIVDKIRPIFSRGFKNNQIFLEEINRTILAYKRDRNNPEIEDVVVVHASNIDIDDIKPHLIRQFSIPINFYEYNENLADIDLPTKIELLPREMSERKSKLKKKQEFALTYSLIGFIIILFCAFIFFKIYEKNRFLKELTSGIDRIQSEVDMLDKFLEKIKIASTHRDKGNFIVEILNYSYGLTSEYVSLAGVSYDGVKTVYYKGTSKDMAGVFGLVKKLEQSKYFNNVEVKYATRKKRKGQEFTDFNIQCQL